MICGGQREKLAEAREEQKWDYINLSDFKSTSCFTPFSYCILYISVVVSIAVYGVDTFTAANLLFFNRWSGQVKPAIPFDISKWIFAGCISLSWILLFYRWIRAVRVIRSGVIAVNYLDPLAVVLQSVRTGRNGRGWRRFLVFAELTKGRKGAEYVALFTYFSFEAWLRIVFAEGPRQVINALTLYSVMQADLVPTGEHKVTKGHTPISQFFINIQILANHNKQQAAILFGMLFTLVIWVLYALGLLIAVLFYFLFLLNHIPSKDNGLSNYCRRKIDSRLQKIVGLKVNKALAKANTKRMLHEFNAVKRGAPGQVKRQPTLPMLDTDLHYKAHDMLPPLRRASNTTYSSFRTGHSPRSGIPGSRDGESAILDIFPTRPLPPSRTATQNSAFSYSTYNSKDPLLRAAAKIGPGPPGRNDSPAGVSPMRSQHSLNANDPSINRSATLRSQDPQQSINRSIPLTGRSLTARSQSTQQSSTAEWIPPPLRSGRTPGSDQMAPANRQDINATDVGHLNKQYEQPPIYSGGGGSAAEMVISRENNDLRGVAAERPPIPPRSELRALGNTTQCFSLNDFRSRTPGTQTALGAELRPQQRPIDPPPPANDKYIAFNPHLDRRPPQIKTATSAPDLVRTATTYRPPTNDADHHPSQAQQRRQQQQNFSPPRRAGTAPLPQRSDSYYDGYSMGQEPLRSGTAPPHSIPPGYEYEDDNFHYITRNQTPAPRVAPSPNDSDAVWWEEEGHRFQRPFRLTESIEHSQVVGGKRRK